MKSRALLVFSALLTLACSGAVTDLGGATDGATDAPADGGEKTVVVVPVPEGADSFWCCEHGAEGAKKFALVDGPAACNDQFGADQGRWVQGPECAPCCCRSGEGAGQTFELTTPPSCAAVSGTCLAGDAEECGGAPEEEEEEEETPERSKQGQGSRKPAKPGGGGGAKRPPAR